MLRQALDSLGKQLIDAVTGELSEIDLSIYVDAVEELRAELSGPRDAGKVKKLMRTLALAGDIEGSLGLAARVSPYVAAGWALVQQLGIS